jgi:hypothetical protein
MEPATFWFVAQYLNHCATAVPLPHPLYKLLAIKGVTAIFYKHAQRCQVLWFVADRINSNLFSGLLSGHSQYQVNNNAKEVTPPSVD